MEGDSRADDGGAVTLYRGVADEAAPLADGSTDEGESTDDGFGRRCAELAGDAVRRATAERATKGAVLRALEELEPLACLARAVLSLKPRHRRATRYLQKSET